MAKKKAKAAAKKAPAKKAAKKAPAKKAAKKKSSGGDGGGSGMPAWKPGALCHTEFATNDVAGDAKFFKAAFNWGIQEAPMKDGSTYTMWMSPDKLSAGGIWKADPAKGGVGTTSYIFVKDADAAAKKIESAGGKIIMPKFPVDDMGFIVIFATPGGVPMGLWQSARG